MGYRLNRLDEPVFITVSKPLLTEFDIHHRLESCAAESPQLPLLVVDGTLSQSTWFSKIYGIEVSIIASRHTGSLKSQSSNNSS